MKATRNAFVIAILVSALSAVAMANDDRDESESATRYSQGRPEVEAQGNGGRNRDYHRDRGDRDDYGHGRGDRHWDERPSWYSLTTIRSREHGSRSSEITVPEGARRIKIEGVHRGLYIHEAILIHRNGHYERLRSLEGRYHQYDRGFARITHVRRGGAVLHLVTSPTRSGRRGYVEVHSSN